MSSASAFKAAYKAFADSGYRLRALIKGLAEEPGILQRARARPPRHLASDQGRGPNNRRHAHEA